jgi:hypothetical protein
MLKSLQARWHSFEVPIKNRFLSLISNQETISDPFDQLSWNFVFGGAINLCLSIPVLVKSGNSNGHFTWRITQFYCNLENNSPLTRKVFFDARTLSGLAYRKIKHILCQMHFSVNLTVFETIKEKLQLKLLNCAQFWNCHFLWSPHESPRILMAPQSRLSKLLNSQKIYILFHSSLHNCSTNVVTNAELHNLPVAYTLIFAVCMMLPSEFTNYSRSYKLSWYLHFRFKMSNPQPP